MTTAPHLLRGKAAEQYALAWLRQQGLRLIASNYHCRYGELDLVMTEQACLVIIEVRYRARSDFGGALASVTTKKQRKISRAAACFLQQHPQFYHHPLRFDVIALSSAAQGTNVDWRKTAFDFSGY